MEPRPVRVLLVDDDEDDYILTRDLLEDIPNGGFELEWVADYDAALEAMCRAEHDVFLLDYRLGERTGLDLMREAAAKDCTVPVILLTGQSARAIDFEAMQAGAADFLEKSQLDAATLDRAIRYTLQQKRHADELERKVRERTAELAQANAALREADRRKDQFLATLAHELRNPLAPIRNALEIMRLAGNDPAAVEPGRAMIERQVRQLIRLIDDLLDLSRIAGGKVTLRKERVELDSVVESAVETSQPLLDAAGHTLTVELPPAPVYLEGDPTRLAQVLINLLNNAAKYTDSGGRITLRGGREGNEVVLRVRDNGIGIPRHQLPHIFEMFTQVGRSEERAQGGLGIGLALVRGLVELHGGTIAAYSEGPGKGSEFVVRLPAGA